MHIGNFCFLITFDSEMTKPLNPICVAIDTPDLARGLELVTLLGGHVGMIKLGMEFFYAHGIGGYEMLANCGIPVFLDLKLHDIPNTVAAGLSSLMGLRPRPQIVNVHASGGPEMLRRAAAAVDGRAKLIAVTILTSLDDADLAAAGFSGEKSTRGHALNLARLSQEAGIDGVVCSPDDLPGIRQSCGRDFLTVVPGIRPHGTDHQDQKRVATPQTAIAAGADYLVIGRAITGARDPALAAAQIISQIDAL